MIYFVACFVIIAICLGFLWWLIFRENRKAKLYKEKWIDAEAWSYQADEAIKEGDLQTAVFAKKKAQEIISELRRMLSEEKI